VIAASPSWWARARLTALYLLTVADIRGTSPKVWNAWKGKLLEDLYRLTLRALGGAGPTSTPRSRRASRRRGSCWRCTRQLPGTEEPLWKTLDVSYFARHDAGDIAWHARSLWRHVETEVPVVRARPSSVGDGLQVLVYSPDRPTCSRASAATSTAPASASRTPRCTPRAPAMRSTPSRSCPPGCDSDDAAGYRDLISLVETQAAQALASTGPAARARPRPRVAARQELPGHAARHAAPDERAQRWLLTVSASDRSGLLYAIARVLARTTSTCSWPRSARWASASKTPSSSTARRCSSPSTQLRIESELLDAVAAGA
jgi:[protein-PII] uridylyltransferase